MYQKDESYKEEARTETELKKDYLKELPVNGSVAIIGVAGRYPKAGNIQSFWQNIAAGKDCITELSDDRWALEGFYEKSFEKAIAEGKSYNKYAGFMDDLYAFDPLFFSISPREAEQSNPKVRLFLQESYHAIEDAGYTPNELQKKHNSSVGVFAGVSKAGFETYPDSFSSVVNRVSFHFNFNGPSMVIDTMCSSSLVAVHNACESIKRNECEIALVGGVNAYLHPSSFIVFSQLRMMTAGGKVKAFGIGADGMVPGEGVGCVLLKPTPQAIEDGDSIYATIIGSATNHGGKTYGYTVPNPRVQMELIVTAIKRANINPRSITCIEAHGSGTDLGDSIEISGLSRAFKQFTLDTGYCHIGSVKTNIGHLEPASGMAGLTKLVLQLKHRKIAPSLHSEKA